MFFSSSQGICAAKSQTLNLELQTGWATCHQTLKFYQWYGCNFFSTFPSRQYKVWWSFLPLANWTVLHDFTTPRLHDSTTTHLHKCTTTRQRKLDNAIPEQYNTN